MRLKRLIVRGFKSFADKTEFDFDADLIGIVGPNGCGKSNVVDALKWVLGDRSAKSLRGAEMTDVIFKGAEGREGLEAAEVTLVLENDHHGSPDEVETAATAFPGGEAADEGGADQDGADGDAPSTRGTPPKARSVDLLGGRTEVSIGRRLTRDKESSYLINGEVVRLKDVRDLLMDTGLGVGAYSVMEQGRIDAVLSADPESRRAIFEEAAGISKFKLQKRETLRKLERTEQNLARVKDLLEERSRRIRSLKIQAGKARRWQEIRGRLRDVKSSAALVDARGLRDRRRVVGDDLERQEARLEAALEALHAARDGLGELEERIAEAEQRLSDAQDRLRDSTSRREGARQRAASLGDRVEELREDAESCAARAQTLDQQRTERAADLGGARARLTEVEAQLVEFGKLAEARREAVRDAQADARALQVEREEARGSMLELLHERTRRRNLGHEQAAQVRGVDARTGRLGERRTAVDRELGSRALELAACGRAAEDLEQRIAWLEAEEARILADLGQADTRAAELARLESGLRERVASSASRLEVLQGMEAHHEGLDAGPRFLLERQPAGLRGRLLDMIDCDLEYSRALEAALGEHVQALVVDTRADAEAMLGQLAAEGKGRATLLIAEEFGDRLERSSLFSLPEGAVFLYRKVRCRPDAWPMVQWLLRGVCFVDGLGDARADRTDLCFVTGDGTLLCGPRLQGGAAEEGARAGLVVRRAQIRSLDEQVRELEQQLEGLQADRSRAQDRALALGSRAQSIGAARQAARERQQACAAERQRLADRIADLDRERADLEVETRELARQRCGAIARLGEHLLAEHLVRRREQRLADAEGRIGALLDEARQRAEDAVRDEQDVRVRQATARSEREALVQRIGALDANLRDLGEALDELEQRREQALGGAERAAEDARRSRDECEELAERIAELEIQRDEASEALGAERLAKQDRQAVIRDREQARDALREEIAQSRLALSDVDHRFERLEDRLRDDTGVELRRLLGEVAGQGLLPYDPLGPFEWVGPPAPAGAVESLEGPPVPLPVLEPELGLERLWEREDFDLDAVRKEVQVLQSQVDRLGAVNLDAVRELDEEERKLGTLEHDYGDLTDARKALMEALRKMELESRALFEQTFEQARENFRMIFRKLFQGGRADMYLTEADDALESGIEIVAKPPGKELQSIALLSGGERSLTALAILFGVFKVKPSPFCILDEVDAALDETNVERFLRVLRDFVGPSHFCVVTHHKRTMAECDVLYGITMQKRGVSTRISVKLDQIDEFTDGPSYKKAEGQRIAGEEHVGF
jgi:chromosome segregation protein